MSHAPPLVVRFGAFGDMVLLTPLLAVLRQRYGAPCDIVSSGAWTPDLMRAAGAGTLQLLDSRRAPYWFNASQKALVRWLRARPAGPVYVADDDDKSLWLVRKGGVPAEWVCWLREHPRRPGEHIVDHCHRLASATPAALAGVVLPQAPAAAPFPRLATDDAARRDCEHWLQSRGLRDAPLILLQPGNKRTMRRGARTRGSNIKYWPEARWAEVARALTEDRPDARVLVCGSDQERELAREIGELSASARVIAVAGELPIPRLLALVERAHGMVSVDTGPAHAAAALGCPLVVLYAHRDPSYYLPRAAKGRVRAVMPAPDYAQHEFPMRSITPAHALEAWGEVQALRV